MAARGRQGTPLLSDADLRRGTRIAVTTTRPIEWPLLGGRRVACAIGAAERRALANGLVLLPVGPSGHGDYVQLAWAMTEMTVDGCTHVTRAPAHGGAVFLAGHEEPAGRPVQG